MQMGPSIGVPSAFHATGSRPVISIIGAGLTPFLDTFLPRRCLHCLVEMRLPGPLCLSCFRVLEQCAIPGVELPGVTASGRTVMAASYYRGGSPLRAVHRAAKYDEHEACARWLARYMARRIPFERLGCVDVCAPVPSHPARLLDRGLDIALALAKGLTQGQKWSIASDLLVRRHLGIPQNELGREERLHNVMNVFGPGTGVAAAAASGVDSAAGIASRPLNVLLVDDVVTTGATLDACASILEARGHRVVLAALAFRREIFQRTG